MRKWRLPPVFAEQSVWVADSPGRIFDSEESTVSNRRPFLYSTFFGQAKKVEDKIHIASELYEEEVGLPCEDKELA